MKNKVLTLSSLLLVLLSLSGCSSFNDEEGDQVLRILNLEDYIYVQEEDEDLPDLTEQFEEYAKQHGYPNCEVVYDTTDTNETMFSEMQTGKSNYDIICTSDYMLQRVINNDMAISMDMSKIPNYTTYASRTVKQRLDEIETTLKSTGETVRLEDYCVGYMWGTLGLLFNPTYEQYSNYEPEEIINDLDDFSILWNTEKDYSGTFSIKDSMRDTYAVALMETFKDELVDLYNQYESGSINEETYNFEISEIFNRCDADTIDLVKETMNSLKANSFGLECDSGKQDIVTGKIGINLAWSGDAVYSMDQAEDEEQVSDPFELWYSVPKYGSNIWFDGWFMPNCQRSQAQYELAHMFLDFICDPENVYQNMDYTGYTSFIGGDSILELTREWYDLRTYYMYGEEEYPVYYYVDEEQVEVDYDTFLETETILPDPQLYYENEDGEEIEFTMEDDDGNEVSVTYNDLLTILDDAEEVDLSYFFEDTLEEYEDSDMVFYSDCYLPAEYEDGEQNIACGRQFFCQFPDETTINRCAVMRDYGDESNKLIMKMWEDFKSDPLPNWAIVLLSLEIVGIVGILAYLITGKKIKLSLRKKRQQENK